MMDHSLDSTDGISFEARTQPRRRRNRTVFTAGSIKRMEELFNHNRYPDINDRESLATELTIPEPRIQVWFQNRRSRTKKSNVKEEPLSGQFIKSTTDDSTSDSTRDVQAQSVLEKQYLVHEPEQIEQPRYTEQSSPIPCGHATGNPTDPIQYGGAQHFYMLPDHVMSSYHDWLSLQYSLIGWQGWYPVLHNGYQQHFMANGERGNSGPISNGTCCESVATPKEACIVDRLFRFSKTRQHTPSGKRSLDETGPYTMKVPRISRTRDLTGDFERSVERNSDGYPGYELSGVNMI